MAHLVQDHKISTYIYTESKLQDISIGKFFLYLEVKRQTIIIFKSWQTSSLFYFNVTLMSRPCQAILRMTKNIAVSQTQREQKGWVTAGIA